MAGESTENVGPSQIVSVAAVAPDGRQVRLRIDDDGNLRCSLGSETVVVDLATVDVTELIAGIANGKTLLDIWTKLSASVAVSGPLTDTELRATAVPVSGPLTDTQLRTTAVPVSGPLTNAQATALALATAAGQASLLAAVKLVALATAVHESGWNSTDAHKDVACADGTREVHGYCGSSFYYKRATTAANTNTLHPAGRFEIPMVCDGAAGVFSILVTSPTDVRLDVEPMGVA